MCWYLQHLAGKDVDYFTMVWNRIWRKIWWGESMFTVHVYYRQFNYNDSMSIENRNHIWRASYEYWLLMSIWKSQLQKDYTCWKLACNRERGMLSSIQEVDKEGTPPSPQPEHWYVLPQKVWNFTYFNGQKCNNSSRKSNSGVAEINLKTPLEECI